jgi:chitin synthase
MAVELSLLCPFFETTTKQNQLPRYKYFSVSSICSFLGPLTIFSTNLFPSLLLGLASRHNKESRRLLKTMMDLVAIGGQATGFFIWPIVEIGKENYATWTIPLAIFLVSAGWWENYVDRRSPLAPIKQLGKIKDRLKRTRYFVYSFISVWKMMLFFSAMLLFLHLNGTPIAPLFARFREGFATHEINVTRILDRGPNAILPDLAGADKLEEIVKILSWNQTPFHVLLIQIFSAYLAYIFGKFACKICIQGLTC